METPLDVLSRAATLIHDQLRSANNNDDSNQVRRELLLGAGDDGAEVRPGKELPTRTKKERRRHDRHQELVSSAGRTNKSSIRREQVSVDADAVRSRLLCNDQQEDAPLDMSTGRRSAFPPSRSPPPPYNRSTSSDSASTASYNMYPSPPEYGRPSVITCASSLRSSPAPSCPSPCSSTGSVSSSSQRPTSPPRNDSAAAVPRTSQRRQVISSGMCDPVIDEHFRRSLGERYTHLFATSSTPVATSLDPCSGGGVAGSRDGKLQASTVNVTGLSVDDHFAKALGETWLKLQNDSNKDKEGNGPDPQPDSPLPSQRHGLILT